MSRGSLTRVVMVSLVLVAVWSTAVLAGGPVCPPQGCGPAYCPPPVCMPPACPPIPCAPAMCPPPACPPRPCGPEQCKPNPLAQICEGAFRLVTGVIALPFKVVDRVVDQLACKPKCGYTPAACGPTVACAPPISIPPYIFGPRPMSYGMARPSPVGFGQRPPRRMSPMAQGKKLVGMTFVADANEGFFGTYW